MGAARVGDVHGSIRNQIMDILIRRLGDHRGAPRLYLDCGALARAGFHPGLLISVVTNAEACRVQITLDEAGTRRVSRKKRGSSEIPVIDLNSVEALAGLEDFQQVRVVVRPGAIHVLALASERKAQERLQRLRGRIESGEPLRCAGIAFGAGITSWALHRGLAASGVPTSLAMANELQDEYLDLAAHHNPVCSCGTHLVNAPMQEAVMDDWVVSRVGKVELLEAGIPCSGASRAGVSKRGLAKMEDHPLVGHLVASVIQWIAALQPAIFIAENVPGYAVSGSAAILRGWLIDAGYVVHEVELDAHDFGSLEGRVRWFLVAVPPAVDLDLSSMAPEAVVHFPGASFPIIPVADGAGEVAALGEGVGGLSVGDRVIPHFMPNWQGGAIRPDHVAAMRGVTVPGSLAEYVVAPATSLVALPAHLDFAQGAALPIAATTAWNAVRSAPARPGSVVVLLGTGGVSLFALQFAKACGATVILASSSEEKLERARQLGADHLINYRATPAWDEQVLARTDGRGADLVVETVGAMTIARSLSAAAVGGTVFTVGFVTGTLSSLDLLPIIVKALRVVGNNTGSVADLAEATRAIAAHRIVPVIDRRFGIEDTAKAYAELSAGGRNFGKLAIVH